MRFFVKAVATGFAMSLGSALFKKVSKKIGLETPEGERVSNSAANAKVEQEGESGDCVPR